MSKNNANIKFYTDLTQKARPSSYKKTVPETNTLADERCITQTGNSQNR